MEITVEQLSALRALIATNQVPYVDFAIFTPHAVQVLKKLRLTGMQIMPDGGLQQVEMKGPTTYHMWEKSYVILRTGLLMLDAVTLGHLDSYMRMVRGYAEQYPHAWSVVYAADMKCRLELMANLRHRLEQEKAEATAAGRLHSFDSARPWDDVWA
eukprot:2833576-Amphidinium_carterae.1